MRSNLPVLDPETVLLDADRADLTGRKTAILPLLIGSFYIVTNREFQICALFLRYNQKGSQTNKSEISNKINKISMCMIRCSFGFQGLDFRVQICD